MEAFQLRLWDGRIGRWLSPDPYGQYASPYLGMGNNPIGMIDPDGGKADWHRDGSGNLVADAGDDAYSLAQYLNISVDEAFATFNQNFRISGAVLGGGELFFNTPYSNTTNWLSQVLVSNNKSSFDSDLFFNVMGTAGDTGEMFDFGRHYIEDNKFLNLNLPSKYLGLAGDAYDLGSGAYKTYNSKSDAEMKSNLIATGIDGVVIGISQRNPYVGAIYGTLKIVGSSDMYIREQNRAKANEWHKKHGYPINDAIAKPVFKQASGMYRNCPTCPLKFR
jgi:hypothetical protein